MHFIFKLFDFLVLIDSPFPKTLYLVLKELLFSKKSLDFIFVRFKFVLFWFIKIVLWTLKFLRLNWNLLLLILDMLSEFFNQLSWGFSFFLSLWLYFLYFILKIILFSFQTLNKLCHHFKNGHFFIDVIWSLFLCLCWYLPQLFFSWC